MTEQLAEAPVPVRVQDEALKLPVPLLVKLTVPVGVRAVPAEVSVTVAVQAAAWFTATVDGVQLTAVVVSRLLTVTISVPELPLWFASPAA